MPSIIHAVKRAEIECSNKNAIILAPKFQYIGMNTIAIVWPSTRLHTTVARLPSQPYCHWEMIPKIYFNYTYFDYAFQ